MKVLVRDALADDLRFIRKLATQSALYGIPYGRSISNSAVKARVRDSLRDLGGTDGTILLVAYLEEIGPIGYLILELTAVEGSTGDRQSYIYDLAVLPAHWGTEAVEVLVREAAIRTAKVGLRYMTGEVSAHNERTYFQSLRLGFELERFQIVMACSLEGPTKMPGRADSEKEYLMSRRDKPSRLIIPGNWAALKQRLKELKRFTV